MAITRHVHTNQTGHQHIFQVDSEARTVHLVKADGGLQFSSTNVEPILALPRVDEDTLHQPVPAVPAIAPPVAIAPEAAPTVEQSAELTAEVAAPKGRGKKAEAPQED